MNILITGSAGFIGSALTLKLLEKGYTVFGIDNHNDYYDPNLKEARLARYLDHTNYTHYRINIENKKKINEIFNLHKFENVVHLAAQAGVRYSIENPMTYIDSNLLGFANILECSRQNSIKHLVYASSSSVYGLNTKQPYSTGDSTNHPISLYAATKKANELMAHSYSHLYNLPTTGLRFFTVYGPYDRPDMALQKFAKSIVNNETIKLYNYGKHFRDFTYIDDIVEGIIRTLAQPAKSNITWNGQNPDASTSIAPYKIYNIGNNNPTNLIDYIEALEFELGKKATKEFLPIQPGDVPSTHADIKDFIREFGYKPKTDIKTGVKEFAKWFKSFYQ